MDLQGTGILKGLGYDTFAVIGWLLLVFALLIYSNRFKSWALGPLFALLSISLLFILTLAINYYFEPPSGNWIDRSVYQCGNEYLITQDVEYTDGPDNTEYRLVSTRFPFSLIRPIYVLYDKHGEADDDFYDQFDKDSVRYDGKTWHCIWKH